MYSAIDCILPPPLTISDEQGPISSSSEGPCDAEPEPQRPSSSQQQRVHTHLHRNTGDGEPKLDVETITSNLLALPTSSGHHRTLSAGAETAESKDLLLKNLRERREARAKALADKKARNKAEAHLRRAAEEELARQQQLKLEQEEAEMRRKQEEEKERIAAEKKRQEEEVENAKRTRDELLKKEEQERLARAEQEKQAIMMATTKIWKEEHKKQKEILLKREGKTDLRASGDGNAETGQTATEDKALSPRDSPNLTAGTPSMTPDGSLRMRNPAHAGRSASLSPRGPPHNTVFATLSPGVFSTTTNTSSTVTIPSARAEPPNGIVVPTADVDIPPPIDVPVSPVEIPVPPVDVPPPSIPPPIDVPPPVPSIDVPPPLPAPSIDVPPPLPAVDVPPPSPCVDVPPPPSVDVPPPKHYIDVPPPQCSHIDVPPPNVVTPPGFPKSAPSSPVTSPPVSPPLTLSSTPRKIPTPPSVKLHSRSPPSSPTLDLQAGRIPIPSYVPESEVQDKFPNSVPISSLSIHITMQRPRSLSPSTVPSSLRVTPPILPEAIPPPSSETALVDTCPIPPPPVPPPPLVPPDEISIAIPPPEQLTPVIIPPPPLDVLSSPAVSHTIPPESTISPPQLDIPPPLQPAIPEISASLLISKNLSLSCSASETIRRRSRSAASNITPQKGTGSQLDKTKTPPDVRVHKHHVKGLSGSLRLDEDKNVENKPETPPVTTKSHMVDVSPRYRQDTDLKGSLASSEVIQVQNLLAVPDSGERVHRHSSDHSGHRSRSTSASTLPLKSCKDALPSPSPVSKSSDPAQPDASQLLRGRRHGKSNATDTITLIPPLALNPDSPRTPPPLSPTASLSPRKHRHHRDRNSMPPYQLEALLASGMDYKELESPNSHSKGSHKHHHDEDPASEQGIKKHHHKDSDDSYFGSGPQFNESQDTRQTKD
ncbi:hypothetical protein Pelo_10790 [Pelomyxa schiedti]|nr:hypothetical protein Pelo_10790 [Pelomyxa schiedti]